jgi:ligand-binding SRPBCC domain-containing protein
MIPGNSQGKTLRSPCSEIITGRADGLFTLETRLLLPKPLEVIFPFFADAGNLERITPPWLHFEIRTPIPIEMRAGTIIDYRLRLHGIALRWQSEITEWDPPCHFVDEQRYGPYRRWIHEHTFTESNRNSQIFDFVKYDPPGGWIANFLFVRRDVCRIFAYRTQKLLDLFS